MIHTHELQFKCIDDLSLLICIDALRLDDDFWNMAGNCFEKTHDTTLQ